MLEKIWGGVERFSLALFLSLFLISSSFANTTTPEINVNYLNEMTGPRVTWEVANESGSDTVLINDTYYKYTYHKPDDYTETNTKLINNLNKTNTNKVVFKGIKFNNSYYSDTVVFNASKFNNIINADFISNAHQTASGRMGGVILNYTSSATLGDITGNFVNNYIQNTSILGDARGGAIYNHGTIGDIRGDFIGNYIYSLASENRGGAIYNEGTIGEITGDFIGNYVYSRYGGKGGAIYGYSPITVTNSSFYNNYVQTEDARKSYIQGGAIYSQGNLNIIANDGKSSVFSGNKIIYKDDAGNDIEESNAIHIDSGTLKLSALEGGQIIFDDKITASAGYTNPSSLPVMSYSEFEVANIKGEGEFLSPDIYGGDIETYLDSGVTVVVQNGGDASWKKEDDKYFFIEKDDYGIYGMELTEVGELNGYTIKTYDFITFDEIGGDLVSYLDNWIADGIANGYSASYEYKEGVYYVYENGVEFALKEDSDAGGVWITEIADGNIIKADEYGGDMEAFLTEEGLPFVEKDGYYYVVMESYLVKIDMSIGYEDEDGNFITKEEAEQIFADAKAKGNDVTVNDGIITISPKLYAGETGTFYQDENDEVVFHADLASAVAFNITGDGTGKVMFNDDIEHDGTITVSNVEVDVNAQGFDRANLKNGSIVNVGKGATVKDTIINSSSLLKIKEGAKALSTMVANAGKMLVQSGGEADNTVVFSGGELSAEVSAKLNNLLANGGAILDIDSGAVLTGDVVINANAQMGGTYDYSKIFKDEVVDSGSLTLIGGLNEAMTSDSLVNNVEDKHLNIKSGDYAIGDGTQAVSGWDSLTISDANVKLEGAIALADASKVINITSDATLDLAGHSPLVTTIIGSVNNDGSLNFHHDGDDADDVINIHGNYTAFNNANMIIDVNPTSKSSDLMIVDGDVAGTTKVTIYKITDGESTDLIKFVDAPNDDDSTGAYFSVHRVYKEALDLTDKWKIVHQDNAWHVTSVETPITSTDGYGTSDTGSLDIDNFQDAILPDNFPSAPTINPSKGTSDSVKTKLVAEALAYLGLPSIGLEQNKDLMRVVSNKVASTKIMSGRCGMSECYYDGQAVNGAWVDLGHKKSDIEAPLSVKAKINAVDMGFDIQRDLYNQLGVFASYRQGEFEFSGNGKDYYSKVGSDVNIDSWILGLYHRYDEGLLWTMSSVYGGFQKVDLSTGDGVSTDTDGIQFGGNIEAGLVIELQKGLTAEPSVRLGYNFIKYDNISDKYGKTAKFDNVQNVDAEVGIKFEKTWFVNKDNIAKLYIKPSVIQNFGKGDVNITSLKKIDGVENQTLIRGEVGGSFNFRNGWSGFGAVAYAVGDDYNSTDFNMGVNYSW